MAAPVSMSELLSCADQLQQVSIDKATLSELRPLGRKFLKMSRQYFSQKDPQAADKEMMATMEKAMGVVEKIALVPKSSTPNFIWKFFGFAADNPDDVGLDQEEYEEAERYSQAFHVLAHPEERIGKFFQTTNQKLLHKWVNECKFPEEAFFAHPDLVKTIFSTHMHQFIRYYSHTIQFDPDTKEMQMMIEGRFQNARPILSSLRLEGELIVNQKNPNETWFYLENGLSKWNEIDWQKLKPCAKLSAEELAYVQEKAKRHPSPQAQAQPDGPCFVLEIVSSWKKVPCTPLTDGFIETLEMPRHPWIRLVTPEGDVYSVGFYPSDPVDLSKGAKTIEGVFRTPDPWEATPFQARFVTRFAITDNQFSQTVNMVERLQSKEIAFNLFEHNCTRFVQHVLETIDIPSPKGVTIGGALSKIVPVGLQRLCGQFTKLLEPVRTALKPIRKAVKFVINECTPPLIVKAATFVVNKFFALQNFLVYAMGGTEGALLEHFNEMSDGLHEKKKAVIDGVNDFFNENLVTPLLPRQIIEWQMAHSATTVYDRRNGFRGQYGKKKQVVLDK